MRTKRIKPAPAGFTLIEVVIAAAIVMILAAIAWPSYLDFVRRGKRAQAVAALMEALQQQERLFAQRNRYLGYTREDNPAGLKWHSGASAASSSHELSARPCEGQPLTACVELRAEPGTAAVERSFRDPTCGILSLTSQGTRSPSEPACWR